MNESAIEAADAAAAASPRARRMERTRFELTNQARRLTVERGLNGYTIEELCEIVGVSRRTFFNYFPSKEDALLGHRDDGIDDEALTTFVNGRPADCVGISPNLLDDLLAMVIATLERFDGDLSGITTPEAVIAREPQLLGKFMREGAEMERLLVGVIAAREGLSEEDPIAHMAVAVLNILMRNAATNYFKPGNTVEFVTLLQGAADAAKTLFGAEPSA